MIRANRDLNKQIEAGKFDPIGILEGKLEGKEKTSCEIPKAPEYSDPSDHEHERHE